MFTFRRVVGTALDDFGLRRPADAPEDGDGAPEAEGEALDIRVAAAAARARRRARRSERRLSAVLDALPLLDGPAAPAVEPPAPVGVSPVTAAAVLPPPVGAITAPAGCMERRVVVWSGRAPRSGELQRFVDHLEASRPSRH